MLVTLRESLLYFKYLLFLIIKLQRIADTIRCTRTQSEECVSSAKFDDPDSPLLRDKSR